MTSSSTYRAVNLTIFGLCIYALTLPVFSPMLSRAFPDVWRCAYYSATGKPCVFCGMTRDFERLTVGDLAREHRRNALSLPVFTGLFAELFWRVIAFVVALRVTNVVRVVQLDLAVHAALLIGFLFIAVEHAARLQSPT
ncbi:MAG: hypothetical protein HY22_09430 [[Candidatus Thermochlorobacteriaceae] bacterium GBChlB]|nr:MAG: hypothetical protein HY22_09430 [[Candidatus Thermochlorobacteriaceae] bacterium GBChlB]